MRTRLSVVIPAYEEEAVLGETLDHLQAAAAALVRAGGQQPEILVIDNASADRTSEIALQRGARVLSEGVHNIARVRNVGAHASRGDVVVFLDADTLVPPHALTRIGEEMRDARCAGGALDMRYRPRKRVMRWYLGAWRLAGRVAGAAMGSGQFCRRQLFIELGGYDETIFMGEDIDFFWRLRRHARRRGLHVPVLRDVVTTPSSRRFDRWPLWRVFVWTNPLSALLLRRRRAVWRAWYTKPLR